MSARRGSVREEYKTFLKSLDLRSIVITESSFRIDRSALEQEGVSTISLNADYKPAHLEGDDFEITAKLTLDVSTDSSKKKWFSLTTIYELRLTSRFKVTKPLVSQFAESDVRLILWPYFREYLSDVCNRVQLMPPIVLPLTGTAVDV